jgi:hypothetical protein
MKYFEGAQLLLWWSPTYEALQELSQSSASHQLKTKHKRMGGVPVCLLGKCGIAVNNLQLWIPLEFKVQTLSGGFPELNG